MVRRNGSGNSSFADSGASGRSSGRESVPKDKSERIRLLIAWWGARRTSPLGPVLLCPAETLIVMARDEVRYRAATAGPRHRKKRLTERIRCGITLGRNRRA